ncbi:MAG: 50S ribosomal protein L24 [Candidatus Shikimatogenerans bostrichidophilus]|nr:MAG: 50S ribosomal protein L24 [Candidatus Shikimatogenerans bostrichidophilus]
MLKIRKKDKIIVISGKNKGKRGIINKIFKKTNKVNVSCIENIKRKIKKNKNNKGKIIIKESKIDISNISIEDPKYKTKTKIGFKIKNGKKLRICKKSKKILVDNFIYKKIKKK